MKRILLAEDDQDFGSILKQYLELAGFEVHWKNNGELALEHLKQHAVDICVLDVMIPLLDGFSLAQQLIGLSPSTPFIFLTARNQKDDRLKGLGLGADDYVAKPFEVEELVLRIRNILKRSELDQPPIPQGIAIGDYHFDPGSLQLFYGTTSARLTEKESALLYFFCKNKGRLVKREEVLLQIWKSDDYFSGRSLDVFVSRLRKQLAQDPKILLETVRGTGFEFNF